MAQAVNLDQLRDYILHDNSLEAEEFVRQHSAESEPVLQEFSHSKNPDIRRIVVELAGISPSLRNCRLLLNCLSDPAIEVKELSISLIRRCGQPEMVSELVEALEQHLAPDVLSAIALLIGQVGGDSEIEPLNALRRTRKNEPDLDHDISIALARLGNTGALGELHQRLSSDVDPGDRVSALNDCLYVGDRSLVAYFGPALNDYRDMVALSIPENPPMEYARVADIAVFVMVQLGVKLSYPLDELKRLPHDKLEEASRLAQSLQ